MGTFEAPSVPERRRPAEAGAWHCTGPYGISWFRDCAPLAQIQPGTQIVGFYFHQPQTNPPVAVFFYLDQEEALDFLTRLHDSATELSKSHSQPLPRSSLQGLTMIFRSADEPSPRPVSVSSLCKLRVESCSEHGSVRVTGRSKAGDWLDSFLCGQPLDNLIFCLGSCMLDFRPSMPPGVLPEQSLLA
jgi:hypothetical protein